MKYISYKENKTTEEKRKQQNQKFLKQALKLEQEYFDNMFKNVDENIKLDENQRNIILTDEDYLMVIAGAGSGKTTTITAKVNYLIDKLKIKDEEIIVISFTNKAVEELKTRINKEFKHNIEVVTFHKFGYKIIKANTTTPPIILKDNKQIIKKYIEENIVNNSHKLKQFIEMYTYYFDISEDFFFYNSYDKYYIHKNKQKYKTLKSKIERTNQYETNSTIDSQISNYLYINQIQYEYKKEYPHITTYKPDFTIKYNEKTYYIEHFNIEKISKFKHKKSINKIRKIHKKYNTKLIELYNDDLIEDLKKTLPSNKIINKTLFNKIILEDKDTTYKKFIELCIKYINMIKANDITISQIQNIQYKNNREKHFLTFIKDLYNYYQNYLETTNQIDFEDLIIKANQLITATKIKLKYKYIIIDEYQDISECRYNLIKNISDKNNSKITIVGDDWQCIYGFAASNINLFTQFQTKVPYCEVKKIETTYRNSQELIDIAGKFIQKNPNQISKRLTSNKHNKHPIKIIYYKKDIIKKLKHTIDYIYQKYSNQKNILILGRYTFDINKILDKEIIEKNKKLTYKKYPNLEIEYMTIHSSKGLGYDNVILINAIEGELGFPSKIKEDPLFTPFLKKETMKYAEERRLFYVAMTRTKNEFIILAPKNNTSIFIKEIKNENNVSKKIT